MMPSRVTQRALRPDVFLEVVGEAVGEEAEARGEYPADPGETWDCEDKSWKGLMKH
jgi:hypothetical protein